MTETWFPEHMEGRLEGIEGNQFWASVREAPQDLAFEWARSLERGLRHGIYPILMTEDPLDAFAFDRVGDFEALENPFGGEVNLDLTGLREGCLPPDWARYLAVVPAKSIPELLSKICNDLVPMVSLLAIMELTTSVIFVLDSWEVSLFSVRNWSSSELRITQEAVEEILDDLTCPLPASSQQANGKWWNVNFRR
jgi:hypothetical protein